ncbi:LamG-like jellyroll fold domain-containing protein [Nonomuraea sp. NPDC005692]|uniref:LamG-like jellyroll fold domain-containing protein n=1 Tax=Nonomuraea sp. NPDC005692 TaxID=3157168 RepID=UPI0033D0BD1A
MNKLVSRARLSGRPSQRLAVAAALTVAASLLVAGAVPPAQAEPEPTRPSAPTVTAFPRPEDPDAPLRAAVETARQLNKPVPVEAVFTETSRTWAYPDGHLTLQSYAGPSQLKQADGSWAWIDTDLVERNGVLKPRLSKADIAFSLGGGTPFASMERGKGQRLALSWPTELPKPEVSGNVARYADAAGAGADLVVTALPTGFRHDVVLRQRPAGPLELRIPVTTEGLTLGEGKKGKGLTLTDAKGRQVASAAEPVAVDAGPSAAEAKAGKVVPPRTGKIDTEVVTEKGRQVLVLRPDAAFLADPATRYPLTVDPTTTLPLLSDVVISNDLNDNTSATSPKLETSLARTYTDGHLTNVNSLLKFDTSALTGRSVGNARLEMYAEQDVACRWYGPGGVEVKRVTSGWNADGVGWSTRPSVTSFGSSVQICPSTSSIDDNGNWIPRTITWDVTAIANAWASGAQSEGVQVSAYTDFDHQPSQGNGFWIYYHSAERVGGKPPKLTVSYWLPPEIPTVTAESIDVMNGNDAIARSQSVKVGFKSSVPEATKLDYTVTVNDSTMAPPPAFPTGHVAHWKFDEADGAASAADAGGNGYTATYTGSRRKTVTGKLGSGIQLNDMTGSNGCCVPDSYASTSKAVLNQNSSFSISTWVKLHDSEAIQYVASQDGSPFGLSIYYLGSSWQKWRLQVSGSGGTVGTGVWVDSQKLVKADTWSHLVAMYDASAGKIRLYVDGVLSGETDYQPTGTVTSGRFRIGTREAAASIHNLQGSVDDMRLYQRALTVKEIKDLYGEVAATSYNAKPSGQVIEQTFQLHNPASLKFVVKACRSGVTPPSCNESAAYRLTSDAPVLPSDTETGMADPTRPILSGMVNRPSGGAVTAKYYLYDNAGAPVGAAPLGTRSVNGGERASFQLPANTVQPGSTYTWQMAACVGQVSSSPDPEPTPTPTPTPSPAADLKARWSFDEGRGTTAADSSGNNHPATLTGTTWGTGKDQLGLQLGGTSASYGVVSGPAIHTNAGYTVSAWAKIDNVTADHAVVSQDGAVNSAFKLAYSPGDKKWRMVTYQADTSGATPLRALSTANAVAGQWTHLVGVYDAAAGRIRLYVDGVLNAETAFTSGWDATGNVQLGRTKANGTISNYLKGTIDEVRLYQKALTAAEIAALYATPAQVGLAPAVTGAQEVVNGPEVCTSKTAPVSFTTPGTPPPPPVEDVRHLTLGKDNFVIKSAKTDPAACDGSPCTVTDDTVMRIGGTGTDKTAAVIGIKLDELPDGAGVSEGLLKLGTAVCPAGACPSDAVITVTPLKSPVTGESKGSALAADADPDLKPVTVPLSAPQGDIGDGAFAWLLVTSDKDEVITFGEPGAAEQPSLAVSYLPAGPPSDVLNLTASGGDGGVLASWGLPTSNGSMAMLDGYDVEVADNGGDTVKTVQVSEPYAAVGGLANGQTFTVKVRARTAFGVSGWQSTTATTKAVPPPAVPQPGTACVPFLDTPPSVKSAAAADSGAQEYLDRVKAYYQAQDAVLEGRADAVWDAPGVSASTPSTAKLSLLNPGLLQERDTLTGNGTTRSGSSVQLAGPVVQAMPDGSVRVTVEVTRKWTETTASASGQARASTAPAGPAGTVEPSEATISIFVFDRCGNITIIDAPIEVNEDSSDHADIPSGSGGGSVGGSEPVVVPCGKQVDKRIIACEVRDRLGSKGWIVRSFFKSHWPADTGEGNTGRYQRWLLDSYENVSILQPTWSFWGYGTLFGKTLVKNFKLKQTGGACFVSKYVKTSTSVGTSVDPATVGASWGYSFSSDAGEKCSAYHGSPEATSRHKVILPQALVESECHVGSGDDCWVVRYKHYLHTQYSFDFKYTTDNGMGHPVEQRYSTTPVMHDLWCKVDRNYGNLFPVNWNSVRYDGVGCQARSTLGKKKPL